MPEIEQSGSTSQHDDDDDFEPTFAPPRKSRLSAPKLQAQLRSTPRAVPRAAERTDCPEP